MSFYKNQKVIINKNRVISLQNGSTPGIYSIFKIVPNKTYKMILNNFDSNDNKIFLWIAMNTRDILYFNEVNNNELNVIFNNIANNTVRIGLLFESGKLGNYFIISSIKLNFSANRNPISIDGGNVIIYNPKDRYKPSPDSNISKTDKTLLQPQPQLLPQPQPHPLQQPLQQLRQQPQQQPLQQLKPQQQLLQQPLQQQLKPQQQLLQQQLKPQQQPLQQQLKPQQQPLQQPLQQLKPQQQPQLKPQHQLQRPQLKKVEKDKSFSLDMIGGENIVWTNNINPLTIELTVALPAYKAEKIIWLALESLRNQSEINFGWELIIWEEYGKSKSVIKEFIGKFPNCQRIIYKCLSRRVLLIDKWIGIARSASNTSRIYVLQAADDYSPPKRLYIHHQHFSNPRCYLSTQIKGLFYNLKDGRKIFYLGKNLRKNHLNMAYRLKVMRLVRRTNINENIDYYLKKSIDKILYNERNRIVYHDHNVDKNNWKYGFFTDGHNTISLARRQYYNNPTDVFYHYGNARNLNYADIRNYIPTNVIEFLNQFLLIRPDRQLVTARSFPSQQIIYQNQYRQNQYLRNRYSQNQSQYNKQQNIIYQNKQNQLSTIYQNRLQQNVWRQ